MTGTQAFVTVLILAVALAAIALLLFRQQRGARGLRSQFGPEYDHAIARTGSRKEAKRELLRRKERVQSFRLHPLAPHQRERFANEWRLLQEQFVDDPIRALTGANTLVRDVMSERGYPATDFEQRAADLSVEHGQLVDDFRSAHAIVLAAQRGEASTEDMRQALVHYRSIFAELLGTGR